MSSLARSLPHPLTLSSHHPTSQEKGWDINVLQFPACIHICVTMAHTVPGVVDKFLADLREITARLMESPKEKVRERGERSDREMLWSAEREKERE